jgi:hypothetical protein
VLHPLPEGAPTNRLGLARWLVSPENPLTARVTVNRFWQELFGTGLVRSSEDFGIMGEPPVNPELLDWLATEFVESGWDVKHLFRADGHLAAYRQSATTTPEKLEKDPANRLLSRGPRFRIDAEMVRDYALAAAGLLESAKFGGPSVKPYQPDGVWEAVAMPESNTRSTKRDKGEPSTAAASTPSGNAPPRPRSWTSSTPQPRDLHRPPRTHQHPPPGPRHAQRPAVHRGRPHPRRARPPQAATDRSTRPRPNSPSASSPAPAARCRTPEVGPPSTNSHRSTPPNPPKPRKLLASARPPKSGHGPPPNVAALTLVANQLLNLDEALNK